jgi:hypothetical protein
LQPVQYKFTTSFFDSSDHGFFLYSPLLRKATGRPRTLRIKGSHRPGAATKKRKLHTSASFAKVLDIIGKVAKKVTLMPSKHLQFYMQ